MDPHNARYACRICRQALVEKHGQYAENLDGGPYAWVVTLECTKCNKTFKAWWLMRLVPTESGVTCTPEWRAVGDDSPILLE